MVQSLNTRVEWTTDATAFTGLTDYGKIMVGDNGFEFYNNRDVNKFIQIPWQEVDLVIASIFFKGKWIPRFALKTKKNGIFTFSSRKSGKTIKVISAYVPSERIVRSLSFFEVIKRAFMKKERRN
ncbi:MAG: DUF956 family protein [Lactobacillales bacterium]|jgi:hypothetical protein|nr:DUF956 family protein [Lactobacillales bacterium]